MTDKAKEERRKYFADYRAKNGDRLREYKRKWYAANPEKAAASQERYWLKKAAERTVTNEEKTAHSAATL